MKVRGTSASFRREQELKQEVKRFITVNIIAGFSRGDDEEAISEAVHARLGELVAEATEELVDGLRGIKATIDNTLKEVSNAQR